ncbi:DUF6138 family protein [Paenibacillus sp. VCA1]|uniref:DUF6138 family protein n=1 Tax=Paenibacillus sp. VCA1 TaxID=3039148 RepID=UPI002871459D|nr:DUF6138 family protein [Paenibacillus sp. VCA1]MDR9855060.1 DUF6138 family protein [Paenibacillus sp. VCA1]
MNQAAEAFLQDVWQQITDIYEKENERIGELPKGRKLQAGINDYLRVAWRKPKLGGGYGQFHIDVYEPFDWSDDSYKFEAGPYVEELTDEVLANEFFPALLERMNRIFLDGPYDPRFFDYRLELVFEFDRGESVLRHSRVLRNEAKRLELKQRLETFIQTKIMSDLPVLPAREDEFFFARLLMNPDVFEQKQEKVDPLIRRLSEKLRSNRERAEGWESECASAFRGWAEERFLPRYFHRTGNFGLDWALKEAGEREEPRSGELEFFIYAAQEIGIKEPDTRQQYLELAARLGSEKAERFLNEGSGRFESLRKGSMFQGKANDILQTIDVRILSEEEAAYGEALDYIIDLLKQRFPKGYKLAFKSKEKHYLPLKKLAKSQQHQFFGNALRYPSLYPRLAAYAELAMEEFAWYRDVEPGEKSVMPGTYAVFGLGLYSDAYFPLVEKYMELVDSEHQSMQDDYADAFIEAHGLSAERMPVLVSILLGSGESAKPAKNIPIDRPELADALLAELEAKEDARRETVLYRIFGSSSKLAQAVKKASPPLKDKLERLLAWYR